MKLETIAILGSNAGYEHLVALSATLINDVLHQGCTYTRMAYVRIEIDGGFEGVSIGSTLLPSMYIGIACYPTLIFIDEVGE